MMMGKMGVHQCYAFPIILRAYPIVWKQKPVPFYITKQKGLLS